MKAAKLFLARLLFSVMVVAVTIIAYAVMPIAIIGDLVRTLSFTQTYIDTKHACRDINRGAKQTWQSIWTNLPKWY